MSVIRTLSASESNEQRDREKAKLEKEYKRSDQRLDELISLHHNDLTQVMQVFAKLSSQVTASREKVLAVKENLQACKMLLHCRRDELKKLWLEGVEHKHVLQLLEEIEQLREVPSQLATYLAKKQYLHATKMLVSALSLGDGSLEKVEALRELRSELQVKKQQLHIKLLEELSHLLYVESTQDVLALRRQGSGRDMNACASPFQRASELRASARGKARRNLLDVAAFPGTPANRLGLSPKGSGDDFDLSEDLDVGNPQLHPEHFIAILIECLAVLGKIPEAVESLKVQMQPELLGVVARTTRTLLESAVLQPTISGPSGSSLWSTPGTTAIPNGSVTPSPMPNGDNRQKKADGAGVSNGQPNHPLPELLYTLLDQFRRISEGHGFVMKRISLTCEKYNLKSIRQYEISDVWSMVQAVMQLVLTDYLDIQNTTSDAQQAASSFSEPSSDISSYFSRRKVQRPKKTPLFKFEHTHNISSNGNLLEEHRGLKIHSDGRLQRDKLLVCPSDPHNITLIFIPITKFIEEIELATNCKVGIPCTLNAFLADYIKEVFLGRYQSKMSSTIDMVTKSPEAWRTTITPEHMKELRRTRPLLQSTVAVEGCVKDLQQLIMALPVYTEHFLSIVTNLLRAYRETCQAAYRGKVQPESEDKRIFSAAFLKDEDISRFIKSLPNWTNLQAQKAIHLQRQKRRLQREETTDEESPEDIRQRNEKEAEILASALGEGGVNRHEIISDVKHLRSLALLQESLEWFAGCIYSFASELPRISPTQPIVRVMSEASPAAQIGTVDGLQKLAKEFEELADTCLLVLHLEVRVQCFHYLLPKVKDYGRLADCGLDSQEPDPKVLELTRALTACDEALTSILQPLKCKYVFEGLGHFMSKILMSVAQYIDRIDEGGIQKMCRNIFTLQQSLTNITMTREVALDHARHYYELFYLTPEEILSGVVEKGPQFSELEYMNAFQLVHRSRSNQDVTALNAHLTRLSDILGEVGVTV